MRAGVKGGSPYTKNVKFLKKRRSFRFEGLLGVRNCVVVFRKEEFRIIYVENSKYRTLES